jgi:hypothetical protein
MNYGRQRWNKVNQFEVIMIDSMVKLISPMCAARASRGMHLLRCEVRALVSYLARARYPVQSKINMTTNTSIRIRLSMNDLVTD